MKCKLYNFIRKQWLTFNVIPSIIISYDKYSAKGRFSFYIGWLFWGFEIYVKE